MAGYDDILQSLPRTHDFFVGVDSDGCAFDSQEIKQKRCFIPQTIEHWNLAPLADLARQTAEFVNLYSRWRGLNRFLALVKLLDLLAARPDALAAGYRPPDLAPLRRWIESENRLGEPSLAAKVRETGDPLLAQTLQWTRAIDACVARLPDCPPFPNVAPALEKLHALADVMVCSTAPAAALQREWTRHNLARYVHLIAGQEFGSKRHCLRQAARGKYDPDKTLMIGDAPADLLAARDADMLFFPILAGRENDCWRRFRDEALDRFLAGRFRGDYQARLVDDFLARLPEAPPWPTK